MIVISPIFYPIFTLTITVIACFTRKKKKQNCSGVSQPHLHQGIALDHRFAKNRCVHIFSLLSPAGVHEVMLQTFMKLCYRRSWSYVTNVHEVMLQTFMKLCYRRSWSYVTDVHEVMLQMLLEFFVTVVMKEMNSFLRCGWNCVSISGTFMCWWMCWWIEHARAWLRYRGECKILSRRSMFPRPLGQSHVHTCAITFSFRSFPSLGEEGRVFLRRRKILVLTSIVSFYCLSKNLSQNWSWFSQCFSKLTASVFTFLNQ